MVGPKPCQCNSIKSWVSTADIYKSGEKKAWNWKKYVAQHVKYNIILRNLMEYGYQVFDPGLKVQYLLNGIRYDKLSNAHTIVRVHPDKYEWLDPNLINVTVSEAEMTLQTSTCDRGKNASNWEKYVAWNVKYHINLEKLMEYGYQGLDPGLKIWYLSNSIRCDKLS